MTKTKKLLSVILSLTMLLSVMIGVDFTSHAEMGAEGHYDGFGYAEYKGEIWITDYSGNPGSVLEFPSNIKGKPVTHVYDFFGHVGGGESQFGKVKSIIVPKSMKGFSYCSICLYCFPNLKNIYYTGTKAEWNKVGDGTTTGGVGIKNNKDIHYFYNYKPTVKLEFNNCTYNGKVKTPSVTVKSLSKKKFKKNTDYKVTYSKGRKSVGTYTVTIKFVGNYYNGMTIKKTFNIKPKATSISKVTAGRKAFTVKWKKQATQTTGYQIQYSTSSKFKNAKTVTVSKNKTTSKKITKLKAKKKYYVRVRTYKTVKVNGKNTKIYSGWSKVKTVTTKK